MTGNKTINKGIAWHCCVAIVCLAIATLAMPVLFLPLILIGFVLTLVGIAGAFCELVWGNKESKPALRYNLLSIPLLLLLMASFGACLFSVIINPFPETKRSIVARVRGDMRVLGIALDAYYLDHDAFPAWSLDRNSNAFGGLQDQKQHLKSLPTFRMRHASNLATLTTPVSYISAYYVDPFSPVKNAPFCYWTLGDRDSTGTGYILWSPGPDKTYDITIDNVSRLYNPYKLWLLLSPALVELTYDPSNGTISRGDVYRYKE